MKKELGKFLEQSWESFDQLLNTIEEIAGTSTGGVQNAQAPKKEAWIDGGSEDTTSTSGIPENLAYLVGRYPMEDDFAVQTCQYCKRVMKTSHVPMHSCECESIPEEEKKAIRVYSGLKYKVETRIGAVKLDRAPPSLPQSTQRPVGGGPSLKRTPAATATVTAFRAPPLSAIAPSSQPPSTSSSTNTQVPSVGPDYLPVIKLERADSPAGKVLALSSSSSSSSSLSLQKKSKKTLPLPLPNQNRKPSVVLKIKGNTSTTSAGRITFHAGSLDGRCPGVPGTDQAGGGVVESGVGLKSSSPLGIRFGLPSANELEESPTPQSFPPTLVPTKAALKTVDGGGSSLPLGSPAPPAKKRRKAGGGEESRKVIPLRERCFNPDEHCGVINGDGTQCKRSLTCKTHSMGLRRAVLGRSHPFDTLIATQKLARDKARLGKEEASGPPSPLVGIAGHMSSVSAGDRDSEASKLSATIPSPAQPPPSSPLLETQSPRPPVSTMIFHGLHAGSGSVSQIASRTVVPASVSVLGLGNQRALDKIKLKSSGFKRSKELPELGLGLHVLGREEMGYEVVTNIIPPDEEVKTGAEMSRVESFGLDGENILLLDDDEEEVGYLPFPMLALPLGRRKKSRRYESLQIPAHSVHEKSSGRKRVRRESPSEGGRLSTQDGEEEEMKEEPPASNRFSKADDESGERIGLLSSPRKFSFRLHPKKVCRPYQMERKSYSGTEGSGHIGPLLEMTEAHNGLEHYGGPSSSSSYDGLNFELRTQGLALAPTQLPDSPSKLIEMKTKVWGEGEAGSHGAVDAPVADSELSMLLAAQFE